MNSRKLIPSWSLDNIKANLRKPLFYFYLVVPALLLILGALLLWMALAGDGKFASRIYSVAFSAAFLKTSEFALRFRLKSKSWPAIVFGTLCTISAIGGALVGAGSDDLFFVLICAALGPLLVVWGVYAWYAVEWNYEKDGVSSRAIRV